MCRGIIFVYQNINDKINKFNVKFEEIYRAIYLVAHLEAEQAKKICCII